METTNDSGLSRALSWNLMSFGFLVGYFVCTVLPVPVIWYYPVERSFELALKPHGLAADFYGRLLWSGLGAAAMAPVGILWKRFLSGDALKRWMLITAAWCAALLMLLFGLYIHKLVGRVPTPAPLPSGYVPR